MCTQCGTKWFIHEERTEDPDLTECGRCGGLLVRFVAPSPEGGYASLPDEGEGAGAEDR